MIMLKYRALPGEDWIQCEASDLTLKYIKVLEKALINARKDLRGRPMTPSVKRLEIERHNARVK